MSPKKLMKKWSLSASDLIQMYASLNSKGKEKIGFYFSVFPF